MIPYSVHHNPSLVAQTKSYKLLIVSQAFKHSILSPVISFFGSVLAKKRNPNSDRRKKQVQRNLGQSPREKAKLGFTSKKVVKNSSSTKFPVMIHGLFGLNCPFLPPSSNPSLGGQNRAP